MSNDKKPVIKKPPAKKRRRPEPVVSDIDSGKPTIWEDDERRRALNSHVDDLLAVVARELSAQPESKSHQAMLYYCAHRLMEAQSDLNFAFLVCAESYCRDGFLQARANMDSAITSVRLLIESEDS